MLGRKRIINYVSVALLVSLLAGACAQIGQSDIKIKDESVAQLIREGLKLYSKEEYNQALERFSQAEKMAGLPEDKLEIADILAKGGYGLLEKNLFTDSLSYYERSLEICRALDFKPGLVNNLSYIGIIYRDIGRYEEGIEYFKEALTIQKGLNDNSGIARNLNNIANLYSYLGNYQESINLLNQALEVSKGINDLKEEASTLINLATINFRLRNYQKSIDYLVTALKIADEERDQKLKAYALNLMGVVYRNQGEYEKALENYQSALKINRELGLDTEIATNLTIIGDLYTELGRYDEALKYFQESLEISESSKDRLITAANMNYIGEVRYKQGNYEEALSLYIASLETFEELGFKDRIARTFNDIGYLKGEKKEWESAIENLDKAIAIYKDLGDREWIRVALFGRGVYSEESGDLASAEKNYKEAIDVLESIREDVSGGEVAEQRFSDVNVGVYERLVALLIRLGKKEEALEYIERSRSKTLRDTFLKGGVTSYDERTRGLLSLYDELSRKEASINYELSKEKGKPSPNSAKVDNLVKTLAKTRKDFRQVTSQLKTDHPEIYKLLSIEPGTFLSLEDKEGLPSDTVFVEYFITDNETYIFLMSDKDLVVKRVSVKKEELNGLVARFRYLIQKNRSLPSNGWRDDGSDKYGKDIKPFKETSIRLYQYLIEPVNDEIREADMVAIIPFGSLHYLPFHALAKEGGDGGLEFLIQKKRLVYLVSTSTDYLDIFERNGREKELGSVVAFGNPDLGEPELILPYSEEEVLAIKEVFPDTTVYLKKEATKDNFKKSWGRHEIVHLAAHGLIQEEPSILLAPLGSGSLTLSDITGLKPVRNTPLVVLSLCDAAIDSKGADSTEAELNSVALAFSSVGASSVIATLWRVDDRATSQLMGEFYKNLQTARKFSYEALRKAQVAMLKRTDRYGQPFYWAPFILVGVWE